MRWQATITPQSNGRRYQITITENGRLLTFHDLFSCWQSSADFRTFYLGLLADTPYAAIFWETPPLTQATVNRPYECMVIDSPSLARVSPNPTPFKRYFDHTPAVTFTNLGRDATLVVPCPQTDQSRYTHLTDFLRHAPIAHQHTFLQMVGNAVVKRLNDQPLWLNTSGLGVHWLHVRLDSRPKYYVHAPYKSI